MKTVGHITLAAGPPQGVSTHPQPGEMAAKSGAAADLRTVGALMAAGGVLLPLGPDVDLPLCALRALTGVPCPLCGMTTATIAAVHGDLGASVAANPAALVLIAAILIAFVPPIYRSWPLRSAATRWRPWMIRLPWIALPLLWLWELNRFGFI